MGSRNEFGAFDRRPLTGRAASRPLGRPFAPGSMILASLANPREKFWGMLLELSPAGVSLSGVELNCFEDLVSQVRAGEVVSMGAVFFPMQRVERLELDCAAGPSLSLTERFQAAAGRSWATRFTADQRRSVRPR